MLAHLPKLEGTWKDVSWSDTVTWYPKVSAEQFRIDHSDCGDKFPAAADGKAYRLDYEGLKDKQFRHVLYLNDFEHDVLHPGVCAPRDKTNAQAVLDIRTVHLTGFTSSVRPGHENAFLEMPMDAHGCVQGNARRPEYAGAGVSKDKCAPVLDYLGVAQTRYLLHGAKRTGLKLKTQFC